MKRILDLLNDLIFAFFHLFPLQNKVVATCFKGVKYGDNPQYILEELHRLDSSIKLCWLHNRETQYSIPDYILDVPYARKIRLFYELATAKVWIDTHRIRPFYRKRKGQLFIETWHGGLGIKKIEMDVANFKSQDWLKKEIEHTNNLADVFISQSDHLSCIYRDAFGYKGPIRKCGYPKNDILVTGKTGVREKVIKTLGLSEQTKILLYAPSFRDSFYQEIDNSVYAIDFDKLHDVLESKFGGSWVVLVRWHPLFADKISKGINISNLNIIDATRYPDMQELILATDVMISDYSSCIFDAAIRRIPCFTFATDFEEYKSDRGVYYEMEELPFPYSRNNSELFDNIFNFNQTEYESKLDAFNTRTGVLETGHAAKDIADKIIEFINTGKSEWK